MSHKYLLISILVFAFLVFVNIVLKPFANKRGAVRVVKIVLAQWAGKDQVKARNQWLNTKKYPPVYDLDNYKIINTTFEKYKGSLISEIDVILNFKKGNVLPSDREWRFTLKDTQFGWKVTGFILLDKDNLEHNPLSELGQTRKPQQNKKVAVEKAPAPPKQQPPPIPESQDDPYSKYKTIPASLD